MEYEPRGDQEVATEYQRSDSQDGRDQQEPRRQDTGQQTDTSFSDQERGGYGDGQRSADTDQERPAPSYTDEERAPAYGTEASRGEETERGATFD
jgi:hypothetical protein